jgi:hypothetical protein
MEYIAEERLVLCVDNAREGKQFEGFGRRSVVVCGEGKEMCWPRNEKASSAGSGRRNESTDGALGDAKFCSHKKEGRLQNSVNWRAKRHMQLQWNQNNFSFRLLLYHTFM